MAPVLVVSSFVLIGGSSAVLYAKWRIRRFVRRGQVTGPVVARTSSGNPLWSRTEDPKPPGD